MEKTTNPKCFWFSRNIFDVAAIFQWPDFYSWEHRLWSHEQFAQATDIVVCRFHEGTSHADSRALLSFIANHTGPEDRSKNHVSTPSGQWLQKRPAATFQWLQWGADGYHSKLSYYLSLNLFSFVGRKFASWTMIRFSRFKASKTLRFYRFYINPFAVAAEVSQCPWIWGSCWPSTWGLGRFRWGWQDGTTFRTLTIAIAVAGKCAFF